MDDTAENLISQIRYQYPLGVTTWGWCSIEGCEKPARGGGRCADCLTDALSGVGDWMMAHEFHASTRNAHAYACMILADLEPVDGPDE